MARQPYHIARQEHLGDMLDILEDLGLLLWGWDYDCERHRAYYWIQLDGASEPECFETRTAESLVQRFCDKQGIVWKPVPHPGGEDQRGPVLAWIERERERRAREERKG